MNPTGVGEFVVVVQYIGPSRLTFFNSMHAAKGIATQAVTNTKIERYQPRYYGHPVSFAIY